MSEFDNTPITPPSSGAPGPAGWLPVWIKAITQPKEQTFVDITEHPDMSAKTAYIWVFIAGTFSGIIQAIAQAISTATGLIPYPKYQAWNNIYHKRLAEGDLHLAHLSVDFAHLPL